MGNRSVSFLSIAVAGFAALFLAACGASSERRGESETGGPVSVLETRRCPTELGLRIPTPPPPRTVRASIQPSAARRLVAYRDAAGTILFGPRGWECEAGIGSDHSERISVFPPGHEDPAEPPFYPGEVVSLQLYTDCKGCMAAAVCALFPNAGIVKRYGTAGGPTCPPGGLRQLVVRIRPDTVIFADPPKVHGTGAGSGGSAPSVGVMSFSEAAGMRKVSCTLGSAPEHLCSRIAAATMVAAATG